MAAAKPFEEYRQNVRSYYCGGGACESTLYNCILTTNSTIYGGGGASGGTPYNCTLTSNHAKYGGGAGYSRLYNCTVTGNAATLIGGGVAGYFDDSGTEVFISSVYNCIVFGNTAPSGANYSDRSTFEHSCTTPLPPGEGNIANEPVFVSLAGGDLRLAYGSPCIDTGTNLSALMMIDLDGNPRPTDGNWDGIASFDMGAYEYHPQTADSNTDGIPDCWCHHYLLDPNAAGMANANPDNDGQTTYQEWIADTNPTNELACFHIERIAVGENGSPVTIHFLSSSNRVYTLRRCEDLSEGGWRDVPGQTARPGSGGLESLSDTNATPQRFYRVEVKLP